MPDPGAERPRTLGMVLAGVAVVAAIGLVTGTRSSRYVAKTGPAYAAVTDAVAPPARSHAELSERPWGRSPEASGWERFAAAAVPPVDPAALEVGRSSGAETPKALEARRSRRAYDGAPPTIPHAVRQGGAAECAACHGDGIAIGGLVASRLPHAAFTSCTQCHVVGRSAAPPLPPNAAVRAVNAFRGTASPAAGARAYVGAPPTIPHSTWMRERCAACHGPAGASGLHTTHPERQSCTQCHAPSAVLDQRAAS